MHEYSCFHAAIGLTSQRDCHSLTQHTLVLSQSLAFVDRAAVYEAYRHGGGKDDRDAWVFRRFTNDLNEERTPVDEPGLLDCSENKIPIEVIVAGPRTRLVFPVESIAGPLRLMSFEGGEISPEERVLLFNLVTLFRNQVNVLDGRERDPLTGLFNRHTFDLRLMQVTELCHHGGCACLAALDIDHFKRVNDTFGHLYGDEVLLHFAQIMQRQFRYTDFLFRFGGEEFIILLTNTTLGGAASALERFRAVVADYRFPAVGQVTVSTGYTQIQAGTLPTTLVDWADRALYRAKETGRNRVVSYEDIRVVGEVEAGATDVELF